MSSEAVPERVPIVAVIPAAGSGTRFGAGVPKQYAELDGRSLLERTVRSMLALSTVVEVVVALAPDDVRFAELGVARESRVRAVVGGDTRAASVTAALEHVHRDHGSLAWALVHDAARPLVSSIDVATLIDRVRAAVAADITVGGGILAVRVADTLKREREPEPARVEETVSRDGLWQAQTPQLFRAGPLLEALKAAAVLADGERELVSGSSRAARLPPPTDEASAMERAGVACLLVEARHPNPKITRPADLTIARALLMVEREGRHPAQPTTCA